MLVWHGCDDAAAQTKEGFVYKSHQQQDVTMNYWLFTPDVLVPEEQYPLVVALHGGWGTAQNQLSLGPEHTSWAKPVNQSKHPAFVLAPRAPDGTTLFHDEIQAAIVSLVDSLMSILSTDPDRIYVSGYSNGGIATMMLLELRPRFFAAAVPVSGWGHPWRAMEYAHVPVWAFHGQNDGVIPPTWMREIFQTYTQEALYPVITDCAPDGHCTATDDCRLNGHVLYRRHLYTEVEGRGHDMWYIYEDTRMVDWVFRQRRRTPEQVHSMFEVRFDVDMTVELQGDMSRKVNLVGDRYPLSDSTSHPLCDSDGDKIFGSTLVFEESLKNDTLSYRFTHSDMDGLDTRIEALSLDRSWGLNGESPPVVFWNNAQAAPPSAPSLVHPADGTVLTPGIDHAIPDVELHWEPGDVSGRYQIQVATDTDFTAIVTTMSEVDRSATLRDLNELTTYYWRVRADNIAGNSSWSSTWSFRTIGMAPMLVSPENDALTDSSSNTVMLEWEIYPQKTSYEVSVSTDSDFGQATTQTVRGGSSLEYGPLKSMTDYYWRVRWLFDGPWSPAWHFTTPAIVGIQDSQLPRRFSVSQNYPNPFKPATTISFALPQAADVTLTVYNVLGRQVRELASGTKPAGTYEVTFDATGVPSGVYLYRLQAGDYVETRRMVVVK
jgi:predicted esterase